MERGSVPACIAKVAGAAASSSSVVRGSTVRGLLVLVPALIDRVAVELLAEILVTPGARLVVLPGSERLIIAVAGALVSVFENLAAVLLRMCLCPFCAGLDDTQFLLKVPHDRSVVILLLELVRGKLETPRCDLVAPAEVLVGAVDELHLGDHVLHEVSLRAVLVGEKVLYLSQTQKDRQEFVELGLWVETVEVGIVVGLGLSPRVVVDRGHVVVDGGEGV